MNDNCSCHPPQFPDARLVDAVDGLYRNALLNILHLHALNDDALMTDLRRAHEAQDALMRLAKNERDSLSALLQDAKGAKDGAYAERNKLVAALSKLFPASLERHPEEDTTWEDDWRWIVFIDLPTGQASWHLHDSELPQFSHLTRGAGRKWDGHTNAEKYDRLSRLTLKPSESVREAAERLGMELKESTDAQTRIDILTGKRTAPEPSEETKPGYDPECQECDAFIDCEFPCGKHPAKPKPSEEASK